jgi:hypothetical protein
LLPCYFLTWTGTLREAYKFHVNGNITYRKINATPHENDQLLTAKSDVEQEIISLQLNIK